MATIEQQENHAFAESVRQQALRIAMLLAAGKTQEATCAALTLCTQAGNQRNRIAGVPTPDAVTDVDDEEEKLSGSLDLAALRREFGNQE